MRCALVLLLMLAEMATVRAQSRETAVPFSPVEYWIKQPRSLIRDTTLLRIYSLSADQVSDLDSSLFWLQRSLPIAQRIRSDKWLSAVHTHMGQVYLRNGVGFKAIEHFFVALSYAERAKDTGRQATNWDFIGDSYTQLKNHEKAIIAETKAATLYRLLNNRLSTIHALNDLGAAYRDNAEPSRAIQVLESSLKANGQEKNPNLEIAINQNLAATYLNKGDTRQAETYAQKAINTQTLLQGRANAEQLSLLALIMGRQRKMDTALTYAARAEVYVAHELPLARERVAHRLFETYKTLDLSDKALEWHEKYIALQESNNAIAQEKRIEMLRHEYDAQQQEARMKLMVQDMKQQSYLRNLLFVALLVFSVLAIALHRSNTLLRKRTRELDGSNEQLKQMGQLLQEANATLEERVARRTQELRKANHALTLKNNEIQEALFQGQSLERKRVASELHNNLGSLLSGVKWRLESLDFDKLSSPEKKLYESVVGLITDAYEQVRHISHNLLPSILEKEGLLPALEKLFRDLNKSGKAQFEMICPPGTIIDDRHVSFELYSCILELINNILKHANARHVVLEVMETEKFHILMISDDGVGLGKTHPQNPGKGLENIHQRLKAINGTFFIHTLKNNRGTSVTLRVPRQSMPAF